MLFTQSCYLRTQVIYSLMLFTPSSYLHTHIVYTLVLFTYSCYTNTNIFYTPVLFTLSCYLHSDIPYCYVVQRPNITLPAAGVIHGGDKSSRLPWSRLQANCLSTEQLFTSSNCLIDRANYVMFTSGQITFDLRQLTIFNNKSRSEQK